MSRAAVRSPSQGMVVELCRGERERKGERKGCGGGAHKLRLSTAVAPAVRRDATEFGGSARAGTADNLLRRSRGRD